MGYSTRQQNVHKSTGEHNNEQASFLKKGDAGTSYNLPVKKN